MRHYFVGWLKGRRKYDMQNENGYFLNADKYVVYYFIMRRFLDHLKNVPFSQ